MKIENTNNKPSALNTNALELVSPPRMTSVIVTADAYTACLKEFETMAASDGARFRSELGSCELAFSLHRDSANIVLLRSSREDVGKARLIRSETDLNNLRVAARLNGHILTQQNIPCLIIDLGENFRSKASPKEIQMAIHALAAAAFGLLRHLDKTPVITSHEVALAIPFTNLSSKLLGKKAAGDIEI